MTWQRLSLCFELLSPLHIGFLPNQPGTVLAPTRCYVPGKNLWGALTASLTPRLFGNADEQFWQVGNAVKDQLVFSYFYLSDDKIIFMPEYTTENGLNWGGISDQEFRSRFTASYVSTAIGELGGSKDQSLHEIEFIKHDIGITGGLSKKALLVGMVWVRSNANVLGNRLKVHDGSIFANKNDIFEEITVGGEQNYGFGRLRRVNCPDDLTGELERYWGSSPEAISLKKSGLILGHLPYKFDIMFFGDIEIVAGREYPQGSTSKEFTNAGKDIKNSGYYFAPGTQLQTNDIPLLSLNAWGQLYWPSDKSKV